MTGFANLIAPLLILAACSAVPTDTQRPVADAGSRKVFVIADAGCTAQLTADPDDCMAIEAMLRNPKVRVVGIMSTYGNKKLATSSGLIRGLFPGTPHFVGSVDKDALSTSAHAEVASLIMAHKHVDLMVLSPATDAKHLLVEYPKVLESLNSVVFVAGRAPGVKFRLSGGKEIRDFNYQKDSFSFRTLLPILVEHRILTYFSGYTAGLNVKLPDGYMRKDFISQQQRAWQRKTDWWFGRSLPSFDTVASLLVTKHKHRMNCYPVRARISRAQLVLVNTAHSMLMFCKGDSLAQGSR